MTTNRLEAFSDAVLAIVITIMVLEMKVPHGTDLESLRPLVPVFLSYVMSFAYLAIYWNNHHHMLQVTERVNGAILWSNMVLLFFLSLVPFVTGWMGENNFAKMPVLLYGMILLAAAISYYVLEQCILRAEGPGSKLGEMVGKDVKGKASVVLYLAALGLAFVSPWIALGIYALVAIAWLVPDRRIEDRLSQA